MNRYAVAALLLFLNCQTYGASAQPPTTGDKQESVQSDYKNRPDPCELKQKKTPPAKAAVPAKQSPTPKQ